MSSKKISIFQQFSDVRIFANHPPHFLDVLYKRPLYNLGRVNARKDIFYTSPIIKIFNYFIINNANSIFSANL